MSQQLILTEGLGHIVWLTLNHPEKRNALSTAMLRALKESLEDIAKDTAVRVVIIQAAGPAFCAGHDLRELAAASRAEHEAIFALCTEVMEGMRKMPQPVLAQVHGIATAAGCQLAASCDLVVAAEDASFATPGVNIGLFCTTPGVALVRAVNSSKKALEMLLTGAPISAREAERIGLVNRVVPADRLAEETRKLAQQISTASPSTIALGKAAFYEQLPLDVASAYNLAQGVMVENAQAADAREGMRAFLEKRAPKWQADQ
jgi:enoyl-CoA hydratase/carnithine racemase